MVDPTGLVEAEGATINESNEVMPDEEIDSSSLYLYNHEASFEKTPGDVPVIDGYVKNPSIQGEAHYNNFSTGASIDIVAGGATTNEQTLYKFDENFSLSGEAQVDALSGNAAIGLTDGRPNVALIASLITSSAELTFNIFDFNIDLGVSASLLSGGIKADFSSGVDLKLGFGAVGYGIDLKVSHDLYGDLAGKALK